MKRKINLKLKKFLPAIVAGLFVATSFFIGVYLGNRGFDSIGPIKFAPSQTLTNKEEGKPKEVDFSLFWEAWNKVDKEYLGEADYEKMLFGAIKGMTESLDDPYTVFMTPKEAEEFYHDIEGSFSGVGIEIGIRNNLLIVISPLKDTPAYKKGLRAQDIILKIDNEDTVGMSLDEAVSKIRGQEGSEVTLTIKRGNEISDYKITRKEIKLDSVQLSYKKKNGKEIAVIRLMQFTEETPKEFSDAISDILIKNPAGVVLDMRGNPGGYMESAVSIASEFFSDGVVVIEEYRSGKREEGKVSGSGRLTDIPLVVLIDEGSASASEIVAGAIKDRDRGEVVGKKSFGKGSVQLVFKLSQGVIKITIAKWLTPNGISITDNGVLPDIEVDLTEDDLNNFRDPQMDKALEII